jgi:bifunctional DNA-binding transcriptional regulator/antitoxin component of YhaV-PrlF toxin-antitoxin module
MDQLTLTIDESGRIALPDTVMERLGVEPEGQVVMELVEEGALIKPKLAKGPLTQEIAEMNLPVGDWEQMEADILTGMVT